MLTLIAKKIESRQEGGKSRGAREVINYMTDPQNSDNPDDEEKRDRVIAIQYLNFSRPTMTPEEATMEIEMDQAMVSGKSTELTDHWVISFKSSEENERPTEDEAIIAARAWLAEMGYDEHYKAIISVHDNTDHAHAHIAVCRVNSENGKVKKRTWWKISNQQALMKIAEKLGYEVEQGTRRRVKKRTEEKTGESQNYKSDENYSPGDIAGRMMAHGGKMPGKVILRNQLLEAYRAMAPELEGMKWGNIHYHLAEQGIQMDKLEHGKEKRGGLVYSMDGEHWCSASQLGIPEMTWKQLSENRGSWRKPTANAKNKLEEARAKRKAEPPTPVEETNNGGSEEKPASLPQQVAAPEKSPARIPEYLLSTALEERLAQEAAGKSPAETDIESAKTLYQAGATEKEVYQYVRFYGASCLRVKQRPANRFAYRIASLHRPEKLKPRSGRNSHNPKARKLWREMAPDYQKFYISQAQKRRKKLIREKKANEILKARLEQEAYQRWLKEIQKSQMEKEDGTEIQTAGTDTEIYKPLEFRSGPLNPPQEQAGNKRRSKRMGQN